MEERRLAHRPDLIAALRIPEEEDPWRVLVSGCMAGWPCGVDTTDYGMRAALPGWMASPRVRPVPFCPEAHTLGAPRGMPDLHAGDGFAVLEGRAWVRDEAGRDITAQMLDGAAAMLDLARRERVDFALLTDRSAACGSQVVSLGCRLLPGEPVHYRRGVGVAAAMLLRAGVPVVSQRDHRTLHHLARLLDPSLPPPDPDVRDHHLHPWVVENLPLPS